MIEKKPDDKVKSEFIFSLAVSSGFPEDAVCFAATSTGLSRSTDGGHNWCDAYLNLKSKDPLPTSAVALSPNFKSDKSIFAGVPGGILRSTDGGLNWFLSNLPSPPPFISALKISPNYTHDGTLLVSTLEDGVFRSVDRGRIWTSSNFGLLDLNVLCLSISPEFSSDEIIFAGTDSGVFRSTNGGRSWRETSFHSDWGPVLSLVVSPDFMNDGSVLVGTEAHGLWITQNRGDIWSPLGEGQLTDPINTIIMGPEKPVRSILILNGDSLFYSDNNGQDWCDWSFSASPTPGIVAVAAPDGIETGAKLILGLADGNVVWT